MLTINVNHRNGNVIIGITGDNGIQTYTDEGLTPSEARELAGLILKHANEAEAKPRLTLMPDQLLGDVLNKK